MSRPFMGSLRIPIDIGPPQTIFWPITPAPVLPGVAPLDMTTVTGVTFDVACVPIPAIAFTWTGGIFSAVAGQLVMTYAFRGGEFTRTGQYKIRPRLAVPGGEVKGVPGNLLVTPPTGE